MSDTTTSSSPVGGIGLSGALFLVLLVLKLTHVIGWSWWWVTAPLWGPTVVILGVIVLILLVAVIKAVRPKKSAK